MLRADRTVVPEEVRRHFPPYATKNVGFHLSCVPHAAFKDDVVKKNVGICLPNIFGGVEGEAKFFDDANRSSLAVELVFKRLVYTAPNKLSVVVFS